MKIKQIIVLIFLFFQIVFAQNLDSLKSDTSNNIISYNKNTLYAADDIILYSYSGIKDIFRYSFPIVSFDFIEPGRPEFVAVNNIFPHQTQIGYNGIKKNDPVHGAFNLRLLSLDEIQNINYRPLSVNSEIFDLNFIPLTPSDDRPYTRLKYLEGDFTYFDLNIIFHRPISDRLSLKLSGFNKGYSSGVHILRPEKGYNYGGEISYSLDTLNSFIFGVGLNRDDNAVRNLFTGERGRYYEDYDYLYINWKYGKNQSKPKMQAGLSINNTARKVKTDDFTLRESIDQYNFFAHKKFTFDLFRIDINGNYLQNYVRGNGFREDYTIHVLNFNNRLLRQISNFQAIVFSNVNYDSEFGTAFSGKGKLQYVAEKINWGSGIKYRQRIPNLQERFYNFAGYRGDKNIDSEKFQNFFIENQYFIFPFWDISSEAGYSNFQNEILFSDSSFYNNDKKRDWYYTWLQSRITLWKFTLSGGMHYLNSDYNSLAPWQTFVKLHYNDNWFNTVIIDLMAYMSWSDKYNRINYNPLLQRFSFDNELSNSITRYAFKAVATIKDAQLFFEMENPLSEDLMFINGYFEQFRQVRFGIKRIGVSIW